MALLPDTYSDKRIKVCIRQSRSFAVVAGAGSGKTTSLVKALDYVRNLKGRALRSSGQRIACITFTNRAVEVIKSRLNSDDLFMVSTLHSFLWNEIKGYDSDIRATLKSHLIPSRIKKKQEDDNGGKSKAALAARKRITELQNDLGNLDSVPHFNYDESGSRDYSKGRLDHDDVIDLAALMISQLAVLRKIISHRYPYIFIDEAQDTFPEIVDALNLVAGKKTLPIVGYFGDPMQQIYENRAGNFKGPTSSKIITKKENYRCSIEVIKLLNSFRTDVQQIPAAQNAQGSVHVRLIQSEEGKGPRKTYTDDQLEAALDKFDAAITYFGWTADVKVKRLFLARQMIARRLGFPILNQLFTGEYASRNAQDDYESGKHFLLLPFINILVPLVEAHRSKDNISIFQVLRRNSPLLDSKGESKHISVKEVVTKANSAIEYITSLWDKESTKAILEAAIDHKLIRPSERLSEQLARPKRTEEYDDETHSREKGDWLADEFFSQKTAELSAYIKFVLDETPFSTQHGVKGEEYEKVLVFYDDTEANWNNYSFSRLLTPTAVGKDPTEGQKSRSQKLAYVCFSRAEKDLKIILFTPNPQQSKTELITQGYFTQDQVSIQ